jgi:hypothetical protein
MVRILQVNTLLKVTYHISSASINIRLFSMRVFTLQSKSL